MRSSHLTNSKRLSFQWRREIGPLEQWNRDSAGGGPSRGLQIQSVPQLRHCRLEGRSPARKSLNRPAHDRYPVGRHCLIPKPHGPCSLHPFRRLGAQAVQVERSQADPFRSHLGFLCADGDDHPVNRTLWSGAQLSHLSVTETAVPVVCRHHRRHCPGNCFSMGAPPPAAPPWACLHLLLCRAHPSCNPLIKDSVRT